MKLHRNSQKRFHSPNLIYFITTNTHHGFEYFREPIFCDMFIENLRVCKKLKQFELFAFNMIYNHLHLLLKSNNQFNISKIMHFLKKNVGNNINKIMGYNKFKLTHEGEFAQTRLQLDERIKVFKIKFINKYDQNQIIIPKFKWQDSFHDHYIRNEKDLEHHYYYTVNNHLKHGLPEDWPYTSLNYPDLIDETEL